MKRHIHADLIIAWANGAIIQRNGEYNGWHDVTGNNPSWSADGEYRIKPKDNVKVYRWAYETVSGLTTSAGHYPDEPALRGGLLTDVIHSVRLDWTMQEREVD